MLRPARNGGLLLMSCRRMKTTTQSGQAWRGYERALAGLNEVSRSLSHFRLKGSITLHSTCGMEIDMAFQIEAVCPCCGVIASGDLNKIDEVFGFRTVEGERLIPQSYCRKCRRLRCSPNDKNCGA